ncbi:receptor-like protein 12 [Dorcoceras hygrometricum]|uniref:Receptor-like protein 12 n=1 Tax=Dorcoceras hygrometricum TaxID=472368 RepID=A0A2Z7D2D2_9LAMI|nr:receptor-like protein 12 [Dorcoceras hygrometricum]
MWFSVDGLSELSEIPKDVVFGGWFIRVIRDSQGCGFRWMVYQSYQRFPRMWFSVDGLSELSEIPKDVVFDSRSIFSMSGEPVSLSGKKSQMKIEYRLLCDILAKSISVKAGSFNAITVEKFSMLTAVVCGVRMNWASVLFNILKKMVTLGSKQAKGFAVQISRLLPVGSINFCRSLQVVQPAYSFAPLQPTVFALRVSQFCTVFINNSLFSRLHTEDVRRFVSSIAFERTVLRSVQLEQNTVSVAPIVHLIDEHSSSDSTSDDVSMDFADQDTAAASISLPAAPFPDVTKALNQLRASIEQISERDDGSKHKDTLLLHLHDFERQVTARLDAEDRVLGALRRDSNDQRNLMSMDIKSSHKQLSTQIASNSLDVVDVRKLVRENHQELNAKVTSLEEQVAATRHDLLDFSAQAHQTLNVITDQLSELVAYINRGGNDKKGEVSSSRPPPDNQNRGSGNIGGGGDIVRTIDNAQRDILERLMAADRQREKERAAEDTIQMQHLIIEALVEEKASLLQTIQGLQKENGAPAPFDDEWEEEPEGDTEKEELEDIPMGEGEIDDE